MAENAENVKKYRQMEPVLNNIQKRFISLAEEEKKRSSCILKLLIDLIINKMKLKDRLFKEMYQRTFFGGSYYDGLRISQPDEFDLDLLLKLPKVAEPSVVTSNVPGHVHVQCKDYAVFMRHVELVERYRGLDKLIDNKSLYLDTSKVLSWIEGVVISALNEFEKIDNKFILETALGKFYARVCKGGPAFTLKIDGNIDNRKINLDIDLVPCFIFGNEKWPKDGFRKNPINNRPDFFVVPKPLQGFPCSNRYWRLSFQEQERIIIEGKKTLKPTVKLLKKMRDNMKHTFISSYYLKTVILWQTETRNAEFWNNSLSYVFMNVLKEYQKYLHSGKVPYFWYKSNNLLKSINSETIKNVSNKIKYIIEDVEKHPEEPSVIAKYLLSEPELSKFLNEMSSTDDLSIRMGNL